MWIAEQLYKKVLKKNVPYYARYSLGKILWKPIRKIFNVIIIPACPFNSLRIKLYKMLGFKIGKNVFIGMRCYLDDLAPDHVKIEDNVVISYGVYFACHGKGQGHTDICLKKGAYIGTKVLLLSGKSGVTVGENAIVGGGSVVVKSLPDNSVAVGNPAKVIRYRDDL